jgi:hypothetical protein
VSFLDKGKQLVGEASGVAGSRGPSLTPASIKVDKP